VTWRRAAALLALLALLAGLAAGCARAEASGPIRVEIRIQYSHYEPDAVSVPRAVPVTFVLINEDPIDHEFLIGDAAFHERHRHGTEAQHGARPNEVSISALTTAETTLVFDTPGTILYICHLPRHEAYGMVGTLTVT
jgi:uncharacterized cupredoxin-like copper-binding protein